MAMVNVVSGDVLQTRSNIEIKQNDGKKIRTIVNYDQMEILMERIVNNKRKIKKYDENFNDDKLKKFMRMVNEVQNEKDMEKVITTIREGVETENIGKIQLKDINQLLDNRRKTIENSISKPQINITTNVQENGKEYAKGGTYFDTTNMNYCPVCYRFLKGSLKIHMRIHTDERPYACEICKRSFMQDTHLKEHMKVHTDEWPYKCGTCNKSFKRKTGWKTHMIVHSDIYAYTCGICKKSFYNKYISTYKMTMTKIIKQSVLFSKCSLIGFLVVFMGSAGVLTKQTIENI